MESPAQFDERGQDQEQRMPTQMRMINTRWIFGGAPGMVRDMT